MPSETREIADTPDRVSVTESTQGGGRRSPVGITAGKLDIEIADDVHVAGTTSPSAIRIRNPLNVPAEILSIKGPVSSAIREAVAPEKDAITKRLPERLYDYLFGRTVAYRMSLGGISVSFPREERTINILAERNSEIIYNDKLPEFTNLNIKAEEGSRLNFPEKPQETVKKGQPMLVVPPHGEKVAYFYLNTPGWLLVTPQKYKLNTEITYLLNGIESSQVVASTYEIKPPLLATIIGAVIGGLLGSLARVLLDTKSFSSADYAIKAFATVVMSVIATIILSRRSGTQPFIIVEDFFGAFALGVLIGYGGSQYFERALPNPSKPG
jgi:hypothetical protein